MGYAAAVKGATRAAVSAPEIATSGTYPNRLGL